MNVVDTPSKAGTGIIGTLLLLLGLLALGLPILRSIPIFGPASLIAGAAMCIVAGVRGSKWFLLPGVVACCLSLLLLVSLFSE